MFVGARDAVAPMKQRVDIYMPLQPRRSLNQAKQMNIVAKTLEPQRVAYMRHVGPYNAAYRVWRDFTSRLMKDGLPRKDSLFIGVPMDNPKVTPPEKLRYDACVTMDEKFMPTKPVRVRTIAGGDYVVARNCPIGAIAKGYEKLFYHMVSPKSGRQVRKAPSFLVAANCQEGMPPTFWVYGYLCAIGSGEVRTDWLRCVVSTVTWERSSGQFVTLPRAFRLMLRAGGLNQFFKQAWKDQGSGQDSVHAREAAWLCSSADLLEKPGLAVGFFQGDTEQLPFELIQLWDCVRLPGRFAGGHGSGCH